MAVYLVEDTYANVLRRIEKSLNKEGKLTQINRDHRCVDVLDDEGNVIEQHYPKEVAPKNSTRGKYIYVGPGQGSYELTYVDYDARHYSSRDHKIKYIDHTEN